MRLFCSLLIFFLLFSNAAESISSSCRETENITYPRHIPGSCGGKFFQLYCEGNRPFLYLQSAKFLVTDISFRDQTFRLVDPLLAADSCSYLGSAYTDERIDVGADIMHILRKGFVVNWNSYGNQSLYWSGDQEYSRGGEWRHWLDIDYNVPRGQTCSVLQYCWTISKWDLNYTITSKHAIHGKILSLLSFEVNFLECLYEPSDGIHTSSYVSFGFMLIFVALLDILLLLLGVRLIFAPCVMFYFLLLKLQRVSQSVNSIEKWLRKNELLSVRRYDFIEISIMTNYFREKLGQGGFGSVYKGKLFHGHEVAIKTLSNSDGDGDDFISEVATIGKIHHANIVRLIGFCSEGSKRALVYAYMPNGSLDKYIFSSSNNALSMEKRREIALGIARGIDYLHRGCEMQILHFDIKPHNILLDHNLTPKISDFGLARLYPKDYTLVALTAARGTIGYIAPELISRTFGVISHKADVYSFGMLLMEMTSGRRNVDNHAENSSQVYYPSLIYDQLNLAEQTRYLNIASRQFGEIEGVLYKVALWCIQMRASSRPSMSRVIEMLQSDAESIEMPPRPMTSSPGDVSVMPSQIESCSIELSEISEEISMLSVKG
ncbi:Protein kinase family protein [Rhynchospora pubera]|uniref:Protein kinase family protein n=1 Tax=Rhynchospora pubera TaxID=906938 RepID=A0AAV8DLK4_9POAL|nr:Protein kinase family protein [Rhynchospora pubera]